MQELLEVVAQAVSEAGADTSTHVGPLPSLSEPCVYVVVPHEFFLNIPHHLRPTPEQCERTIGLSVEHPGTASFEISAFHAASLGAVMDISDDSTAELRRRGLAAERFRLGYSGRWDVWRGVASALRPVDITYLGTTDVRRDAILARQADQLSEWECRLLIPPHEWMTRSRPDFLIGQEKLRHLSQSKVLINLHRGSSRALEWVRALEAMANGCVIVSERSREFEPLIPGQHVLFARPENTVAVAATLLRNPDRLGAIRQQAYERCRALDMRPSAIRLAGIASSLLTGVHQGSAVIQEVDGPRVQAALTGLAVLPPPTNLPELAPWAAELPAPLRSVLAVALSNTVAFQAARRVETHCSAEHVRVDVVIPVTQSRDAGVGRTVRSLRSQPIGPAYSLARWEDMQAADHVTPTVERRGPLLNALVEASSAEYVLVLEPGQELFVQSLSRLVDALDNDPSSPVAFGMMADPNSGELWNALPLEPERLARRAYLCAPFLVRRATLAEIGDFAEDPALSGYEYHDFWCRVVERGMTAVLVPQILGTGAAPRPPELGIAQVAPELSWEALRRRAPRLLGVR